MKPQESGVKYKWDCQTSNCTAILIVIWLKTTAKKFPSVESGSEIPLGNKQQRRKPAVTRSSRVLTDSETTVIKAVSRVALAAPLCAVAIVVAKVGTAQSSDHLPGRPQGPWSQLQGAQRPVLHQPPLADRKSVV